MNHLIWSLNGSQLLSKHWSKEWNIWDTCTRNSLKPQDLEEQLSDHYFSNFHLMKNVMKTMNTHFWWVMPWKYLLSSKKVEKTSSHIFQLTQASSTSTITQMRYREGMMVSMLIWNLQMIMLMCILEMVKFSLGSLTKKQNRWQLKIWSHELQLLFWFIQMKKEMHKEACT